jgi:hypothetical protein
MLIDDGKEKNFDLAINFYDQPDTKLIVDADYILSGGINKFKAAYQLFNDKIMSSYAGFMFLDDDLEITYSQLSQFLDYCETHEFDLAQPSLSLDSYYSHRILLNTKKTQYREVTFVEVMCPFFSKKIISSAYETFNLSFSTWGLGQLWTKISNVKPIVVDHFEIRHTKSTSSSGDFYKYMRSIGVSPIREVKKLSGYEI